jgi:cell fate regulator YaaT (PSP1 superfamily)
MGCSNCGTGGCSSGGCQSNGTCSSGGCNKLGVFDWLANMKLPQGMKPFDIAEIRFKNGRKSFYKNTKSLPLNVGDIVVVEANPGFDVGVVSIVGELARIQVNKKGGNKENFETPQIYRIANQDDVQKWMEARNLEKEVMYQARTLAVNLNLDMKISDVEYQGDLSKATFYYTSDDRVDFRQLIKDMAEKFKVRIEMRQIGSRQEASRLGGIGSCGRELCCSTWLTDFRSVSTSAARYQQLSLNPQKLAGQCGKLKCCLNYELDMYLDAIKQFPPAETKLYTEKGTAFHVKTDVFKKLMWFVMDGENEFIPLSPDRVKEIVGMNQQKKKPHSLKDFMIQEAVVAEIAYENVVGQDSLSRFDDNFGKKKKNKPSRNPNQRPGNNNPNQQPNPNQNKGPRVEREAKPVEAKTEVMTAEGSNQTAENPQKNRNNNNKRRNNNRRNFDKNRNQNNPATNNANNE